MLTLPEIRQLSDKAIREEVVSAQNDLLKIQFDIRNGSSKESHKVQQLKKYIARLKTVEKEVKPEETKAEKKEGTEEKVEKKVKKAAVSKPKKVAASKKKA